MEKIPVIIDTDPGIDDTFAIMMTAANKKYEIKAMTTTHGNVGLEGTTRNALDLSEFLGINCPVAKGADKPLIVPLKDASEVHGKNGMGGYELPRAKQEPVKEAAWDLIYKIAKEENGKLNLLVLGPMTNIAIAVLKYPDLKKYINRIYMMGGSRSFGNHSQYAEFNIWGDPHACSIVLDSGIKITMCDLVFGKEHYVTSSEIETAYAKGKKLKPMMEKFLESDKRIAERLKFRFGSWENYKGSIYDATAAAAMILDEENALETKDYFVVCETQGTETFGQTVFDYIGNKANKAKNVQLAIKMDRLKYYQLLSDAISYFE